MGSEMCIRDSVRTEDPLRTAKNLGFSLNTMLRKSAETTGIHPVYLDIISSNFAMLIENANSIREAEECKSQMISAYCRFVRKNRLDQYSPLVRKAVTYIRIHLADQLTLAGIAKGIRVSPSYLSRLFNRETGDSISQRPGLKRQPDFSHFPACLSRTLRFMWGLGI